MSIVLRDVGPSLVGGLVLPHEGTIRYSRSIFDVLAYKPTFESIKPP